MTPEAKLLLSSTIRALRERLLKDLRNEAERSYRLSVAIADAELDESLRRKRARLDAWLDESTRGAKPKNKNEQIATRERFLQQAVKEAAATWVNRLVVIRQLEAMGLSKPAVVTGGWASKGYREFREFAPALCAMDLSEGAVVDESEGYATLLQLLCDELALDLPGLFGDVGLSRLFVVPAGTLKEVVAKLDDPALESAWTDDTTLGWVYQYWNDPERELLDAKIADGGKIEPHEIASKTQMFTERYMVEWLLHNSLGVTWLAICEKNGWKADAHSVLDDLEQRRVQWRAKREAGEVALDELMPIENELEECWKYYVPQAMAKEMVAQSPGSVRELRLLDPAAGSGHFLVIAFTLLARMYREEAIHRGQSISDKEIAESILEHNLYGIDIDPRAIQISAAALWLKARGLAKDARPKKLNLVAPVFQLGNLPASDPALVKLREELAREVGVSETLTMQLVKALAGVDYLGSLFQVDAAITEMIREMDEGRAVGAQLALGETPAATKRKGDSDRVKAELLHKLEVFLAQHSQQEDLGLRLDGEQLAAGVRFVRIAREGAYDVVVGNPPYQGLSKTNAFEYVAKKYPAGKADLYAAFLERGLQLTRDGGLSALVTMRGWMFLGQFAELRKQLLTRFDLVTLGDLDRGAFEAVPDEVLATVMSVLRNGVPNKSATAIQPTPLDDRARDSGRTARKRAALLAQRARYEFDPRGFAVIEGEPIVYWWSKEFLARYAKAPKLRDVSPARVGIDTGDNTRFLRFWHEVGSRRLSVQRHSDPSVNVNGDWVPFLGGARGHVWDEGLRIVVTWANAAFQLQVFASVSRGGALRNMAFQFRRGVAYTKIGSSFSARVHRYKSVFDGAASSIFPTETIAAVCCLNSSTSRFILESLNPTINFQVGDVNRLPVFPIENAEEIFAQIETAFTEHESHREASVEFREPGPSAWKYAQEWAQRAVDRAEGVSLAAYEPVYEPAPSVAYLSYALGVALGRFGANGEGILSDPPTTSLPDGILFLTPSDSEYSSLNHRACAGLIAAWKAHHSTLENAGTDLSLYLRKEFFAHHKGEYENRPIYFPLSSGRKSYVAWVSIHRWHDRTLQTLLADFLLPEKRRLEGELEDLRKARAAGTTAGSTTKSAKSASGASNEKRFTELSKLNDELQEFITRVSEIADVGAPPSDASTPKRDNDARFVMDLDDGVMVNSAALWPLLDPQWKDPKKWWKELCTAKGRKDYDWSHLAARYFRDRVEGKCKEDPSLAVAHKCFWRLHPAKAFQWELRLQQEIREGFTIDEPGSDQARERFERDHAEVAKELRANEQKRRERKESRGDAEEGPAEADEDAGAGGEAGGEE